MSKKRLQPPAVKVPDNPIDVPLPFRLPTLVNLEIDAHKKWMRMLSRAETLVNDDKDLQYKAAKGLAIKERRLPPEILGRLYAQYCEVINDMYDAYLNNVQLQRVEYIQEIVNILVKRMFELRNELVHFIVNDYIFVDSSLIQLFKTPFDVQIVVPYHFAVDSRPDSVEELLQQMWKSSIKRQKKALKPPKAKRRKLVPITSDVEFGFETQQENPEDFEEEIEEEEEEEDENVEQDDKQFENIVLIQRHERFRKFFMMAFVEKACNRRTYFARKDVEPARPEVQKRAASLIQRMYRRYMQLKREHVANYKRDVLLGLTPDVERRPMKYVEENNKLYEKRRQKRKELDKYYQKQIEKEKARIFLFRNEESVAEEITEHIFEWFKEWYYGYNFFPQYPYETEAGTVVVIRGDYATIPEQEEADEKFRRETMGKTKEQIAEEKKQKKEEAKEKALAAAAKAKKDKMAYEKARCSPLSDPGYQVLKSEYTDAVTYALRRYRMAWGFYDKYPMESCGDLIYGYFEPLITEEILAKMQLEVRTIVDQMMRLELKVLVKALQHDYEAIDWKWKKQAKRKRPKPLPPPKPFNVDEETYKSLEPLFDMNIITKPTVKLHDVEGDLSYGAYEKNIADPNATFPSPGYGDVKRRLVLSCVFGSGIGPEVKRNRSVMLVGLEHNGKTFMADACAGEMGAVKFDISPEVFSAKTKRPAKMLTKVFLAARIFQPSVIFLKNIERVFAKNVSAKDKKLKAKSMKAPLKKLLKTLPVTEKMIFIATCSDPNAATMRPMFKMFSETILVPKPDYSSLQRLLYDKFMNIRSMPRDFCVSGLAKVMRGLGYGAVIDIFNNVLNSERICRLNVTPFSEGEFIEYMIVNDIEQITDKEYEKLMEQVFKFSPLKKEREAYKFINMKRADAYLKIQKAKEEAELKAQKKKGGG